jgi:hypothetical protein
MIPGVKVFAVNVDRDVEVYLLILNPGTGWTWLTSFVPPVPIE